MAGIAPFIPAFVAARQHATVRKFQAAGADGPARARTLGELGVRDGHLLGRLVRAGVLAKEDENRYFLSAEGWVRWRRRRRLGILIAAGVVLVGALVAWGLAGS